MLYKKKTCLRHKSNKVQFWTSEQIFTGIKHVVVLTGKIIQYSACIKLLYYKIFTYSLTSYIGSTSNYYMTVYLFINGACEAYNALWGFCFSMDCIKIF